MFYNTGINTYIWMVTNRKPAHRRGKVQLVNGVNFFQKMRKSLGDKRKRVAGHQIAANLVALLTRIGSELEQLRVAPDQTAAAARQQLGDFLNTGSITDTCLAGKPCYSRGYTGP